jgi:hypothetical protein
MNTTCKQKLEDSKQLLEDIIATNNYYKRPVNKAHLVKLDEINKQLYSKAAKATIKQFKRRKKPYCLKSKNKASTNTLQYRDIATVKPHVARFLGIGDKRLLENGDLSNSHWILKKEYAPKALIKRTDKQFGNRNVVPNETIKTIYEKAKNGSVAKVDHIDKNCYGLPYVAYKNEEGKISLFNENYISYLDRNIKGFELRFNDDKNNPAEILSKGKIAGLLMPVIL